MYRVHEPKIYFEKYLREVPFSLALFRSIEAAKLSNYKLSGPILDLGCGFGEFAEIFFENQGDFGLDINEKDLILARRTGKYRDLICSDARNLTFRDNSLKTVISVSVLEHIDNVERVINEVHRSLMPDGLFLFTVNTSEVEDLLFWPKVLVRLRLGWLSKLYVYCYHSVFRHKTLWTQEKWKQLLVDSGFKIVEYTPIITSEETKMFDMYLLFSLPSQLLKIFLGRRVVWRPRVVEEFFKRKYLQLVSSPSEECSNLFIAARKPLS